MTDASDTQAPLPDDRPRVTLPNDRPRSMKTARTVLALMLREMSTTYGRTPGGYLWAVLEPVAAIALMSVVFAAALRSPSLGTSFGLFYATAFLPFTLYNQVQRKVGGSLRFSRQLLRYPGVRYIDAVLARFLLNVLTHVAVAFLLLSAIMIGFRIQTILDLQAIVSAFALAALLGLGLGTLNCFLMARFPVWDSIWGIVTTPMFIISGIFYILEDIPEPFRSILWYNPLIHITGLMRTGFYPTYDATYVSTLYVAVFGLVTLVLGIIFLNRYYRDLLNL